jgi:hypothetical protein
MGTRGAFGVTIDGVDKIGYNQYDSYLSVGGMNTLRFLRETLQSPHRGEGWLRDKAARLRLVSEGRGKPTKADIQALKPFTDLGVSTGKTDDWYCLTRHTHGSLEGILVCGYILDSLSFLSDSLFCEYAYVINCDTRKLEVYRGYQRKPHRRGRFAEMVEQAEGGRDQYYPVALVTALSFDKLPSNLNVVQTILERQEFADHDPTKCLTCGVRIYRYDPGYTLPGGRPAPSVYYDAKGADHGKTCRNPRI